MPDIPTYMPQGIVRIGYVPFDSSYRHTVLLDWQDEAEMAAFFAQHLTNTFKEETYTYVRWKNAIRVNYNAETLYEFNYCMFQNKNYTDRFGNYRWFYAFIEEVNYINESCTELVISIDVIHTFWFDLYIDQCFVIREHVASDEVGEHLVPEPSMAVEYEYDYYNCVNTQPKFVVIQANAYPHYEHGSNWVYNPVGALSLSRSHIYQYTISGCTYIIYDLSNALSVAALERDLEAWNKVGAADTIADMFTLPNGCWQPNVGTQSNGLNLLPVHVVEDNADYTVPNVYTLPDGIKRGSTEISITPPTTFGSYTPKNNKVFIYPYNYIEVGDFSGRYDEYRFEFFQKEQGNVKLLDTRVCAGDCVGYITPKNYMIHNAPQGDENNYNTYALNFKPFTYDYGNKVSWTYSTFENWMAQNQMSNTIATIGGVLSIAGGVAGALSQKAGIEGASQEMNEMSKTMNMFSEAGATKENGGNRTNNMINNLFRGSSIIGGIFTIGAVQANIDRMRHHPNVSRGNISGNSKLQQGYAGYYYAVKRLRPEFAKIVDDYFTCYGYEVDCIKQPEIFSRIGWNYVQCANCDVHGMAPQYFLEIFNAIMNRGITFWHSWAVGRYDNPNTIVT